MRIRLLAAGLGLAAIASARAVDAQQPAIVVKIVEAGARAPLAGVTSMLDGRALPDSSDAGGTLAVATPPAGRHTLVLRKVGFAPDTETVTVNAGWTTTLRVAMHRAAVQLSKVHTQANALAEPWINGFDARRAKGGGFFFDHVQIDSAGEHSVDGLLRGHTTAALMSAGAGRVYLYSRSAQIGFGGICLTQIYYNGVLVFKPPPLPGEQPPDLRQYLDSELEAVEYYPEPASTPVEFRTGMAVCGTLLLWGK